MSWCVTGGLPWQRGSYGIHHIQGVLKLVVLLHSLEEVNTVYPDGEVSLEIIFLVPEAERGKRGCSSLNTGFLFQNQQSSYQ